MKKIFTKIKKLNTPKNREILLVILLLVVSGFVHAYNMFNYPYYENDEGTYTSRAWSFITQGKLDPYTFWYDHVPFGWMMMGMWAKLTGGFFTFGMSANSGRVFMLVLHLISAYLLYDIARKLTKRVTPGIIATIIFSFSPLVLYFQRRVLLDNIMVFWMLFSLWVLLRDKISLKHIYVSALAFGLGVLSKEPLILFLPAYVYTVFIRTKSSQRRFSLLHWLSVSGLVVGIYFLYALFKGELLPPGALGTSVDRVSLLGTLSYHAGRGSGLPFYQKGSEFLTIVGDWIIKDPVIVYLGFIGSLVASLFAIKVKSLRIPTILFFIYLFFLIRGKLLLNFYVIPIIPIWGLSVGILVDYLLEKLSFGKKYVFILLFLLLTVGLSYSFLSNQTLGQFTKDENAPQREVIEYIKKNVNPNDVIVSDNSFYVDLKDARFPGDRVYPNAEWAWKVEKDPQVYEEKINKDWKNIDYLVLSHEVLRQIYYFSYDVMGDVIDHAYPIVSYTENSSSFIDIDNRISTNGDWMAIYEVKSKEDILMDELWASYKENFIISYGQVIDPVSGNTTSEGQSYGMLRAVWQKDKETFNGVWQWTKDHMQHRLEDRLLSWLWKREGEEYVLGDPASASDADQDIALALLFAYRQWGDQEYLTAAKEIINDIWRQEVVLIEGDYYLTMGAGPYFADGYMLNPSYISPAHYRIFAEVDKEHNWNELARDSYTLLNRLSSGERVLPPNWIFLTDEGFLQDATGLIGTAPSVYGFDAMRIPWRVGLDYQWFQREEALAYLQTLDIFAEKWNDERKIYGTYKLNGAVDNTFETLSQYGNILALFSVLDKDKADEVYVEKIQRALVTEDNKSYWGEKTQYYDQNWVWFGVAFYLEKTENLFKF